jgi:hypothetical protein
MTRSTRAQRRRVTINSGCRLPERDKLIGAMVAVIDDYERQEEDLIARAADAGQDIPRRHDASPAAILGVRVTQRKAEAA